jgi:hypothetical protein
MDFLPKTRKYILLSNDLQDIHMLLYITGMCKINFIRIHSSCLCDMYPCSLMFTMGYNANNILILLELKKNCDCIWLEYHSDIEM